MPHITCISAKPGPIFYSYYNKTFMLYGNLRIIYSPKDKQEINFKAKDKEEMLDFICGNTWPEFMEEFIQLIIQDLTYFN